MDSEKISQIRKWLSDKNFPSDVTILNGHQPGVILVFVPSAYVRQKKSKGITSNRQMIYLKKFALLNFQVNLEFRLINDEKNTDIESGLCALARNVLSVQNIQIFLSGAIIGKTDVWIDLPTPNDLSAQKQIAQINELFADYLNKVGIQMQHVYWQDSMIPTSADIIRAVKVLCPVTLDDVGLYLNNKEYPNIPKQWLVSKLDGLRRQGFIAWHDGKYIITSSGLLLLPPSRGRASSDIERILAFKRRY